MNKRQRIRFPAILLVLLLANLVVASCGSNQEQIISPTPEQEESASPALDGQALVEERCTRCHDLARTTNAAKTAEEWQTTVERMVSKGADLSPAEQEVVIQYLAETYPE
jgi:cytochrome c5